MIEANRQATTSDRLTQVLSYGTLLLLLYLVFLILTPFLIPLAWSAVLAIFFYPVYRKLQRRFSSTWASLLCTLGVTLLLIMPVLLVLLYAAREAIDVITRIRETLSLGGSVVPPDLANSIRNHLPHAM